MTLNRQENKLRRLQNLYYDWNFKKVSIENGISDRKVMKFSSIYWKISFSIVKHILCYMWHRLFFYHLGFMKFGYLIITAVIMIKVILTWTHLKNGNIPLFLSLYCLLPSLLYSKPVKVFGLSTKKSLQFLEFQKQLFKIQSFHLIRGFYLFTVSRLVTSFVIRGLWTYFDTDRRFFVAYPSNLQLEYHYYSFCPNDLPGPLQNTVLFVCSVSSFLHKIKF